MKKILLFLFLLVSTVQLSAQKFHNVHIIKGDNGEVREVIKDTSDIENYSDYNFKFFGNPQKEMIYVVDTKISYDTFSDQYNNVSYKLKIDIDDPTIDIIELSTGDYYILQDQGYTMNVYSAIRTDEEGKGDKWIFMITSDQSMGVLMEDLGEGKEPYQSILLKQDPRLVPHPLLTDKY